MILVDTSIWIDHLRHGDAKLIDLLSQRQTLTHPFIIGELAMGSLRDRTALLRNLGNLSRAIPATDDEVLHLVDNFGLFGRGIRYIDGHLVASARLTPGASLWTRDRRLRAIATELGVSAPFA